MTTNQALIWAIRKLKRTFCRNDSPALDAEVILSAITGHSRENLLIHPEKNLIARQFKKFKNLIIRRSRHEPIAYITGKKNFFGLEFKVNRSVLIPRPETELLVEETIKSCKLKAISYKLIIDVGTGSGAIAIAIAKHISKAKIIATDISAAALKIAKHNAKTHGVAGRIKFIKTDLLPKPTALIVANLPYLPTRVWKNTMPDVKKFEPKEALLGGIDGLKIIKRLLTKIKKQNIHGMVLLEIDPSQKSKLQKFISKLFPQAVLEIKKDLAGLSRMAIIKI